MRQRLLETKFHIPTWNTESVSRPRLLERLQIGLREQRKLTIFSAPPGYGKTTLLAEWIYSSPDDKRISWLSLDENDNDPARFILYLLSALQRIDGNLGQSSLSLLGIPQMPPLNVFLDELINDLSNQEISIILILDDYHVINNPGLHKAVEYLIEHKPAWFHLVITTREDPPLPLARLRARGQLTEIRAHDLQFTFEETTSFFNHSMQLNLAPDVIQMLEARTEGWAVGLQLTALALQNLPDQQNFLTEFSGSHRYVVDYLLEEVLKQQPDKVRLFLKRTAVLNRFNSDLCQAVTGDPDSAYILDRLEKSNMFLIPLDAHRGWYRYHHLFADVVQTGLSHTEKKEILACAAAWFESQGLLVEAITNWLAAKSYEPAVRLIGSLAPDLFRTGELQSLLGWLNGLPEEIVTQNPEIVSYKTLSLIMTGQIGPAQECADHAFAGLPGQNRSGRPGRLLALQSMISSFIGRGDPAEFAQAALAQMDEDDLIFRAFALISIGNSFSWKNDLPASSKAFRESWEIGRNINHPFITLIALTNLVINLVDMGKLREAESLCRSTLAEYVDNRGRLLPVAAIIYSPLAGICFEKGDFDEARRLAESGLTICRRLSINDIMGGQNEITLAYIDVEEGRPEQAFELLQTTMEAARLRSLVVIIYKIAIVQVDLYLLLGKPAEAKKKLQELEVKFHSELWEPDRLLAYFWARYRSVSECTDKELATLVELEQNCRRVGYFKRVMSTLVYEAIILQQKGRSSEAYRVFESALSMAAPEGYRSLFFPHPGRPTRPLLEYFRQTAPDFVESICGAANLPELSVSPANQMPDPFSEQEIRVIKLIVAGKSNQEIADELVISVGTAKWHVHNVLRKMGVKNRPQAIARALEMGF